MKSEINDYNIKNSENKSEQYGELTGKFYNDNAKYVKETPMSEQKETSTASETFDLPKKEENANDLAKETIVGGPEKDKNSTVIKSTLGGFGAIAGAVTTAVVTAVIVVAVFVSTLSINVSLVLASYDRLIFKLEMTGAQKQDFEQPIYAVLSNKDGPIMEQEVFLDTTYIYFYDLQGETEYSIKVKNSEKVFVEKSFFTASDYTQEGSYVYASFERNDVYVYVEQYELKENEFYTLLVKDETGKTVFAKDDNQSFAEYNFPTPKANTLFFTVSVNGKINSFYQLDIEKYKPSSDDPTTDPSYEPYYDIKNPIWTWSDDYSTATLSFEDMNGGQPLEIQAEVDFEEESPYCEEEGVRYCYASVEYDGEVYDDEQEIVLPATGHEYGEPIFYWFIDDATGEYAPYAIFSCQNDQSHSELIYAEVTLTDDGYLATIEFEGKTYTDTHPYD